MAWGSVKSRSGHGLHTVMVGVVWVMVGVVLMVAGDGWGGFDGCG